MIEVKHSSSRPLKRKYIWNFSDPSKKDHIGVKVDV